MNLANPIPAVAILVAALATTHALHRRFPLPQVAGRFASVDGLRGYLALGVFVHHACIWHGYLHFGEWRLPPSRLYSQLGETAIALFFMVTGFLFGGKLLDGRRRGVDWVRLYASRLTRLVPLYLVAVTATVAMAWSLSRPGASLGGWKVLVSWLAFTFAGDPDLFGVRNTFVLVAGATWTLPYEWAFYLCLPLLAVATGAAVAMRAVVLAVAALALVSFVGWHPQPEMAGFFASGWLAAVLARRAAFVAVAQTTAASLVALAAIAAATSAFPNPYSLPAQALLALAFCLIAAGNTLFGAVTKPAARMLGELSYGVYLLHGLVLAAAFLLLRDAGAATLDPARHWLLVVALTPLLIGIAYAANRCVERPCMRRTGDLVELYERLRRAARPAARSA